MPDDAYEWRITIMMYTALHAVEALLIKKETKMATDHYGGYSTALQSIGQTDLSVHFLNLVQAAQKARYDCLPVDKLKKLCTAQEKHFQEAKTKLFSLGIRF
ncbi:hypothetical protein [Deinococcus arboris]|uniref:hypothetical protein n=1 Tax=Deinococcus arboris TaxID=2682977 RepID=UPI0018DCE3D6|nr:hypothetical protein [Deinococcus arboris]